jgi:hypothetical protein
MHVRWLLMGVCLLWAGSAVLQAEETAAKTAETRAGTLSEKPGDAGEGVVAVLTVRAAPKVRGKNETKKEGDPEPQASSESKIILLAEGDMATRLMDLAKRNSTVEVSGILNGASMKVTQVIETAEGTTAPKRKKK